MPTYLIKNKTTGEVQEMFMSLSAYEEFKQNNPDHEQVFTSLNFQDSVSLGIRKPPIEFKECVLDRIKRANPLHNMSSRWE